jgi:plasmid stabilization system protein ParE
MNYRLKYLRRATQALADIWMAAADRNAVTRASHRLERLLKADPLGVGESRAGRRRLVLINPLAVFYTVDPAGRQVVVTDIRSR